MKKVVVLLWALLAFSCSGNEGEKEAKEENHQWTITLNEKMLSSSSPVQRTENFLFDRKQLINRFVKQEYEGGKVTYETKLTYAEDKVTVTTDGFTSLYTLNADGYAERCAYRTNAESREYLFTYSTDGYLTQIDESINNESYSNTILTYNEGDLTSITSTLNGMSNQINYEAGDKSGVHYLPCLGILETYPFGFHVEALYAGIMGKSPRHLTIRTQPERNETEYTTYTYQLDAEGRTTQIHSKTTYKSTDDSSTYYPNLRKVSVSY